MPGRDHLGPRGEGAMTGRKLGDCNKGESQSENTERLHLGFGRGNRQGEGMGRNRRPGSNRLYRNRRNND